jgi:hypothetical protein
MSRPGAIGLVWQDRYLISMLIQSWA